MKEIMLLGDSIRMFYQERVRELLGEAYNVSAPAENGRFAAYTFNSLRMWLPTFPKPDVIHFNNGLWDTAILYAEDGCFTPLDEYIRTMERIVRQLKKTGARLIFATTTPTHPGKAEWVTDMPPRHVNADIERYNAAAVELMKREGIAINDLYHLVSDHIETYVSDDWIHPGPSGVEELAQAVASKIKEAAQ